jgi:glycogenin glucosyltransferase
VFELTEFDKILYLDSDLYINKNIDELFCLPNLSAVISGKGYVNEWVEMNSGLMVIEPKEGLVDKMLELLKNTKFDKDIGDQDIINIYFDWKNKNLAISEKYNIYYFLIDYYVNSLGYDLNDFRVIHFIGENKPWMMSEEDIKSFRENAKEENKMGELMYFDKYLDIIKKIS